MLRSPCLATSDSATPEALTRLSMMSTAWAILSWVIASPVAVDADSVIRVPPWRSSPSFGAQVPMTATATYIAATQRAKMISVRPGRDAFRAMGSLSVLREVGRGFGVAVAEVVVGHPGLGRREDPGHRPARHPHLHPGAQLDAEELALVRDVGDRGDDAGTEQHLVAHRQPAL